MVRLKKKTPEILSQEIEKLALRVAALRIVFAQFKSIKNNLLAELQMSEVWLENDQRLLEVKSDLELEELNLRQLAVDAFEELKIKTFVAGVGVSEHGYVKYDRKQALAWCREKLPVAIIETVDEPTFEAAVKALPSNQVPDFVEFGKTPTGTISSTLHEKVDPQKLMELLPQPEDIYTIIEPEDQYGESWPEIRERVFERDHHTCQRCKRTEEELVEVELALECDHVIPLSMGGTNAMYNLRALCGECHSALQIRVLEQFEEVES